MCEGGSGCECVRVEVVVSVWGIGGYECVRVEVVVTGWLSVESWADLLHPFSNTHMYSG